MRQEVSKTVPKLDCLQYRCLISTRLKLVAVSSPVPFADTNLIRFNGSRINGLSLMALRQVKRVYKNGLVKPSRPVQNLLNN